jgi:mevalonate kinase
MKEKLSNSSFYPAKLLLFGEYTIIDNSEALAIPYSDLNGKWDKGFKLKEEFAKESNQTLKKILTHFQNSNSNLITNLKFDYEFFSFELEKDLWFNSDIPIGYGLGSSGALCAAIYDKFATVKSNQIEEIMLELAEIERFFHGQSYGIDPLVSFLKKSIVIDNEKKVKIYDDLKFENLRGEGAIFVIDTKISRSTTNLVEYYKSLKINSNFKNEFINPLSHLVSLAIEQFLKILNYGTKDLLEIIKEISSLQFKHLEKLIPDQFQNVWKHGLKSNDFHLKLCGAGGGGFILGITKDWNKTSEILQKNTLKKVFEI